MTMFCIIGLISSSIFAAVGFAVGIVFGVFSERKAWTMRAMSNKPNSPNTPHHCDGEFYYIIPEQMFCEEFQRKQS